VAITQQRCTFDAWLEMPDDGKRYQLLDGELVELPTPSADHATLIVQLIIWLSVAERAGFGRVLAGPVAVLLDAAYDRFNAPVPDALFLGSDHEHRIAVDAVEGVPDLVIEVLSPSTRRDDLPGGAKWRVYERFGIPFYWIVDPRTRTVACYTWREGRYEEPLLRRRGDVLENALFPGITLPVDAGMVNK